jgi:heme/copper-type cytochrome/quinol oxidase subunit 2
MLSRRFLIVFAFAAAVLIADAALGCPTCKDQLAHDPEGANIARGYFWSILFMLSMPPLILTGLGSYFYWEVRRARLRQGNQAPATVAYPSPPDVRLPELA